MKKPFKIILSLIAALVFLPIAAVIMLPLVIDPNDFKPEIAALVKDKTGRELTVDGELKFSLLPWLGVSTGKMTLSNAPGFQDKPFASLEEGEINLRLLPLLSKKIEVSRIVLKGLVLNLAKDKQGSTNWADLSDSEPIPPPAKQDQHPAPTATPAAFSIGCMVIENAQINWDDQKAGQQIEIKDFNLNTDKFVFDQPVAIAASLVVLNAKTTQAVKLNTELSVNERLDTFAFRHSDLQITGSGETVPGKSLTAALTIADIAIDMNPQTAKISGLQLTSGDVTISAEITGNAIKDKPSFQGLVTVAPFSPAKAMRQLAVALPVMRDANALSNLSATFDFAATADSVDLQNLRMTLDDTQINGAIGIKGYSQPVISFNADIDALDADRYLPPVDKSSKPLASPAVLLAVGASAVPLETLRKLNIEGTVALGKLKVNGLVMQDIHINLSAKNGAVATQQSIQRFYQGSYSGKLSINAQGDKPALSVDEKISHVQLEPLLKDYQGEARISGLVNASAQLQGQGRKTDELKASLNGQFSFLFKDSVLKGFNLQKIIDEGKALIKGSALPADTKNDQTLFSDINGTATVTNGLIQNNDLVAQSSKLHVDGKGSLNLNSEALDYKVDAKLLNTEAATTETDRVKAAAVINIAGTLSQPSYSIDVESL